MLSAGTGGNVQVYGLLTPLVFVRLKTIGNSALRVIALRCVQEVTISFLQAFKYI